MLILGVPRNFNNLTVKVRCGIDIVRTFYNKQLTDKDYNCKIKTRLQL